MRRTDGHVVKRSGVRLVAWPLVRVVVPSRADAAAVTASASSVRKPDSLAAPDITHDPFRTTRRPSGVTYDPVRLAQLFAPPAPKPVLSLVGIVWDGGGDPSALIEGLPSTDGPRAVGRGDVTGGLRVRAIKTDRVVITGLDTTWVLTMREPWK
jgi:hypothetical protein